MIRKTLTLTLFLAAGFSFAAPPTPAPIPVEILRAEFGVFDASDPRELVFEPTRTVPHRQGQRYGWIIELQTRQRSLSVREEYLLPLPAKLEKEQEASAEVLEIRLERRNQVSQRQLVPVDGKIFGEWAIGPGEPAGHRHLQVVIEGQVAASFEFDVK